ncbi:hypothetical protein SeMB42_g06518 [Synchytrium endobioticum]|uniref:Secreted protein n=1 Tax=Synchytrium endobioticum TaxID=286115 RepID=A0A507CL12_9FUNG|nr:hypothetical protein SeMB42_g06518 [Synchytrium endobioticum]
MTLKSASTVFRMLLLNVLCRHSILTASLPGIPIEDRLCANSASVQQSQRENGHTLPSGEICIIYLYNY